MHEAYAKVLSKSSQSQERREKKGGGMRKIRTRNRQSLEECKEQKEKKKTKKLAERKDSGPWSKAGERGESWEERQ